MHSFISQFETQRQRIWPEIEAFFGNLPPSQRETGWGFTQRLGREVAPTGDFKDAFKDPNTARIVYLPLWHIRAYHQRGIDVPNAEALETDLFASAFFCACALRIYDDIIDGDKPHVSPAELPLASLLMVTALRRLHAHFPADSPLWPHYDRFWLACTDAVHLEMNRNQAGLPDAPEHFLSSIGHKNALLKVYPVAVAISAGQNRELARIETMMDVLHIGSQLSNDLCGLKGDVALQNYTYPIAQAALLAGYEPGTHPPIEGLYGALFATDAIAETHRLAIHHFERARNISADLGIDALCGYLEWHMKARRESQTRRSPPAADCL